MRVRTGSSCQWDKTLAVLLTPASGSVLNTSTITDACQWEFVNIGHDL
ncbi:hypothetical protein SLEP1_g47899 [Rubroshorea leprosula]|uniref:Uncharacterized protein n=1 Tax=Rubroshorea leprosula TaxID=152421 RepID=A0AAV5LS54_9ROSI|nr:hypothetical protein SLEP1_g47899 [Rubroshorea leprosula]